MCTRIVRRLPLAAGVLVLGGAAAQAQEAPEPQASQEVILEEVVVTAPKEEKPFYFRCFYPLGKGAPSTTRPRLHRRG